MEVFANRATITKIEQAKQRGHIKALSIVKSYIPAEDSFKKEIHARVLSNLAHLERIAIKAAKRGDGIDNQLEDEFFHHFVFKYCAEKALKLYAPDKPTQDLIDYLEGLNGANSMAVLNVVAEGWLETVFHYLSKVLDFIPDIFIQIEEDEHRHSHEARKQEIVWSEDTENLVRDVEKLLFKIANSPFFMLPLVHIMGREECSYMGEALARSHEESCRCLSIKPKVSKIKALARNGRNLLRNQPLPVNMRPWDLIKSRMWKTANEAAQVLYTDIEIPDHVKLNPAIIQLRLCRALGRIYTQYPELRKVYRNGQIYEPTTTILGIRVLHNDRDQVGTIFFNPDKYSSDRRLLRMINRRKHRMDNEEYNDIPDFRELEKFLYPSYAVATISSNGSHGGLYGCGPLIDIEGIGTAFTIGEIQSKPVITKDKDIQWRNTFTLAIKMDHRMSDGKDIGLMAKAIKNQFERTTFN